MPTANAREQSVCPVIIFFPCFNFCYQLTAGYQVRGIQLLNLVCTLCYLFLHTPPPSGCSVVRVVAPYLRSPDRVLHTACVTAGKSFFLGKWWHLYVHSTIWGHGLRTLSEAYCPRYLEVRRSSDLTASHSLVL